MSEAGKSVIEMRLRELAQLFNSLDPSPFYDRDLDTAAEEFIVDWARELPAGREFELVIQVAVVPTAAASTGVEEVVHNYFGKRVQNTRRSLRRLFRLGRWSLLIGLIFLASCLTLASLVSKLPWAEAWPGVIGSALEIVGWVALWRPLEIFLYDWWPMRDDIRLYERLARMRVRVIVPDNPR